MRRLAAIVGAAATVLSAGCSSSSGRPAGGRVVLVVHGLGTTAQQFAGIAPFDSLIAGLRARGWRVVVPALPCDGPAEVACLHASFAGDAGAGYDRQVVDELEAYRPAAAVGISFGGLAVEQLVCSGYRLSRWAAHEPATDPSMLKEFRDVATSSVLPSTCDDRSGPGWVGVGLADTRVGAASTVIFAGLLPRVTLVRFPGLAHSTTTAVVGDVVRFIGPPWFQASSVSEEAH